MKNSERLAQRTIESELGSPVVLHDDNSAPSMYDLRIGPEEAPAVAIEVVGSVDRVLTQTWNTGPAKGPFSLAVKGDWEITIRTGAMIRDIKKRLAPILREMEKRNLNLVDADFVQSSSEREILWQLRPLGVCGASCFRMPGTGQIHLGMEGTGGAIDSSGNGVPLWIARFLRDPAQADVLFKLRRTAAAEKHVFVLVEFGGAPWDVQSYLGEAIRQLPSLPPELPDPVTGVWIASTQGRYGVRWTDSEWRVFDTRAPDNPTHNE